MTQEATAEEIRRENENVARTEAFAKRLRAHRMTELGISYDVYGQIIGCTGLSVYSWEAAKAYPREHMVRRIEQFMHDAPTKREFFDRVDPKRRTYSRVLQRLFTREHPRTIRRRDA